MSSLPNPDEMLDDVFASYSSHIDGFGDDEEVSSHLALDAMLYGIKTMQHEPDTADAIIRCDGQEFPVHSFLFKMWSPVLAAEIKKDTWKEGSTKVIEHAEFDAKTVGFMIDFLYQRTYNVEGDPFLEPASWDKINMIVSTFLYGSKKIEFGFHWECLCPIFKGNTNHDRDSINTRLIQHTKVWAIADYYDIKHLKTHAMMKLRILPFFAWRTAGFHKVLEAANPYVEGATRTTAGRGEDLWKVFIFMIYLNLDKLSEDQAFSKAICRPHGAANSFAFEPRHWERMLNNHEFMEAKTRYNKLQLAMVYDFGVQGPKASKWSTTCTCSRHS